MGKIKGCFIDQQPNFYKDVFVGEQKIARIHALSRADQGAIEEYGIKKQLKGNELIIDINSINTENMTVYRSLIGADEAGWEFDKEVTFNNVCDLDKTNFDAIKKAVSELAEQNKVTDAISKN